MKSCLLLVCAAFLASAPLRAEPAAPAAPAPSAVATVPGDDIFGLTTPSDPGNPGDTQYFNENDGRVGKRAGGYGALNSKFAIGHTFAPNWWIGGAFFTAWNHAANVPGLPNVDRFAFDGTSIELLHRIIERDATNPFGVTVTVEPRWSRTDGVTGLPADAYQATFKLFIDAPVIADTLYWGSNVQFTPARGQNPLDRSQWISASQLLLSSALTWQPASNLFVGVETRYFTVSDNATLSHEIGRALYVGPTMLWKATDKVAVNVTFQPQVYGRALANPNLALDLDDFERAQFRAKLVVAF